MPPKKAEKKTEQQVLRDQTSEYKRMQSEKSSSQGGVEARVLVNIAHYRGETQAYHRNGKIIAPQLDANQPHIPLNLAAQRWRKLRGRLSAVAAPFKAQPDSPDPRKVSQAEVVDIALRSLDEKLDEATLNSERLDWCGLGGVAFEMTSWRPDEVVEPVPQFSEDGELLFVDNMSEEMGGFGILPESQMQALVEQGVPKERFDVHEELDLAGDIESEILGPLNVFIPANVKSIEKLAPDQSIMVAKVRTRAWVEQNFPDADLEDVEGDDNIQIVKTDLTHVGESLSSLNIKDMIPIVQGSRAEDDPEMFVVVERFQPVSRMMPKGWMSKEGDENAHGGRQTAFIPGKAILEDSELKYADGIPIVDFHWEPTTTTFWNGGYFEHLAALVKFLQKRLSQAAMYANAWVMNPVLLGEGLDEDDVPMDRPGFVKNGMVEGRPNVTRMSPPQIGGWFMQMFDFGMGLLDQLSGGADLFKESKFPGQMRGTESVPLLQEILDTEWLPFHRHWVKQLAKVKQMRLNRMKQFYPPVRTMHYTSRTKKDEVLVFHSEEILRGGTEYNITVDSSQVLPELRAMNEMRVQNRLSGPLSGLYMDRRTGQIDWSKVSRDLKFGDTGREEREAQARTLQIQLNEELWKGVQVPALPWNEHAPMMDEIEAILNTTEFMKASEQIQQAFVTKWQQHQQFLQEAQQAQSQAAQQAEVQSAVAQASQQAAVKASMEAVELALPQMLATLQQFQGQQQQVDPNAELVPPGIVQ